MRFKLVLKIQQNELFPFNYQYELSAALFKVFMHIKNSFTRYTILSNQDFLNHITFSRIEIPKRVIEKEGIRSLSRIAFLKISMGFPDIYSDSLWKAFSRFGNTLCLYKKLSREPPYQIKMQVKDIEFLPSPEFQESMKFKMLSPLVLTQKQQRRNRYLSFCEKEDITSRLKENLLQKFQQLYSYTLPVNFFDLCFDPDYYRDREEKDLYSLIKMKECQKESIMVMGLLVPFTLKAPPELIQVGYYSGFGEKTSLGFGMVEVAQARNFGLFSCH